MCSMFCFSLANVVSYQKFSFSLTLEVKYFYHR